MRAQAVDHGESVSWIHQAADWIAGPFIAAIGIGFMRMRAKLKRVDQLQQEFVTIAQFDEYKKSRVDRDEKVDAKLDDIKETIVDSARQVHERVDGLYTDLLLKVRP